MRRRRILTPRPKVSNKNSAPPHLQFVTPGVPTFIPNSVSQRNVISSVKFRRRR